MTYQVEFKPSAANAVRKLPRNVQGRILAKATSLGENPRPPGAEKLTGSEFYRVRVGDYRIIYEIRDEVLFVLVVRVAHRREVYRGI